MLQYPHPLNGSRASRGEVTTMSITINPEIGIALIVFEAVGESSGTGKNIELGQIVLAAKRLEEESQVLPEGTFAVYESGVGFCSRVVDRTVGNYLSFGYATQRNPLTLTSAGKQRLNRIIQAAEEKHPAEIAALRTSIRRILEGFSLPA